MKNYAAILILTILNLTALTQFAAAQSDSYFADQVKLSKPAPVASKQDVPENVTAPLNDNFADAETLVLSSGTLAVVRTNASATKEATEPNHADNVGGTSVWFNFTPTATKAVEIRTIGTETNFDTMLAVYKGNSLQNLTRIGSNDDCYRTDCATRSRVRLLLNQGVTYRIAIDGYNNGAAAVGAFRLTLEETNAAFEYDALALAYDLGSANSGSIAGTNHLATAEANEPGHSGGDNGGRSVWYRWKPSSRRATTFEMTADFRSEIAVYVSTVENPTFAQLIKLDDSSDKVGYNPEVNTVNFAAGQFGYYFIAIDFSSVTAAPSTGNFQLKFFPSKLAYSMRTDQNDAIASVGIFRPSSGIWANAEAVNPNINIYKSFGLPGDKPVPADFDGDGISNYAVTRNINGLKHWYILQQNSNTTYTYFQWGLASDKEFAGDFDHDGIADAAVIRKENGRLTWYIRQSSGTLRIFVFGFDTDKPVLGDFDGDGATEIAVTRKEGSSLVWYILRSSSLYTQLNVQQFGLNGDIPAVEDFDGDGKTDLAVYRPTLAATWYIQRSGSGEVQAANFGISVDTPQPADFDGDGKADIAVYRSTTGEWFLWKSATDTQTTIAWGVPGDVPISSLNSMLQQ